MKSTPWGLASLLLGAACLALFALLGGSVAADGRLHEAFALLPLGWSAIALGVLILALAWIRRAARQAGSAGRGKAWRKICLLLALALLLALGALLAHGKPPAVLRSPAPNVLCDRYVCADEQGISRALTEKHLGKKAAATQVFTSSDVDLTEFTFANGIFCDVKERLCRKHRYYGAGGKRSGAVSQKYTRLLFGAR